MLVSAAHAVHACLLSATPRDLRVNATLLLPTEGTLLMIHCMPGRWIGSAGPEQWCNHMLHSLCIHALELQSFRALPLMMHCN